MKVLLELRPALAGHAGIPQETRLLFRGLAQLPGAAVDGLLQTGDRLLSRGLPAQEAARRAYTVDQRIDRLSRVVVSLKAEPAEAGLRSWWQMAQLLAEATTSFVGSRFGRPVRLGRFDAEHYKDYVWGAMFARTLAPEDFDLVTAAHHRVMRLPWSAAHAVASFTDRLGSAWFPRLDTSGYDVFVAETPYPGRVRRGTALVVRYHDAFPILMPHTIIDRERHRRAHLLALRRNVRDGAWFACVSDAARRDLVSVFPPAEPRTVTIPNMVSHHYFPESASVDQIEDILLTRGNPLLQARVAEVRRAASPTDPPPARAASPGPGMPTPAGPKFLLMVSTIEPRKNQLGLIAAWERLRAQGHADLRLVLVGAMGWEQGPVLARLLPWVNRGLACLLDDVPATELRLLYRYARVTVCPSLGEGFGFSGVESMSCGGVVAASDLSVHREVYGEAAEYFNPYSAEDMAGVIGRLLSDEGEPRRQALVAAGTEVARRCLPKNILPLWREFFDRLARGPAPAAAAN